MEDAFYLVLGLIIGMIIIIFIWFLHSHTYNVAKCYGEVHQKQYNFYVKSKQNGYPITIEQYNKNTLQQIKVECITDLESELVK